MGLPRSPQIKDNKKDKNTEISSKLGSDMNKNQKKNENSEVFGKMDDNESCPICHRLVLESHNGLQCDLCDKWYHCTMYMPKDI